MSGTECVKVWENGFGMRIADAKRFLKEIKTAKTVTSNGDKSLSSVNAAYRVLVEAGRPMRVKEIAEVALENGYCKHQKEKADKSSIVRSNGKIGV